MRHLAWVCVLVVGGCGGASSHPGDGGTDSDIADSGIDSGGGDAAGPDGGVPDGGSSGLALEARPLPRAVELRWADVGAASYDVLFAPDSSCDPANLAACPGSGSVTGVTSPRVLGAADGLVSGTHYTFWLAANFAGGGRELASSGTRPDELAIAGDVYAMAKDASGRRYLGGAFARVGARSGGAFDLRTDTIGSRRFPIVDGTVDAFASDGAGGWYIGGSFAHVDGLARASLAHVTAAGTVDAWDPGCNGPVSALVRAGTTLYVGGYFTSIGGQARKHLAALDTTQATNNATAWDPQPSSSVWTLAYTGGVLYVGGAFTSMGPQVRHALAAFDASGALTAWNPNATYAPGPVAVVYSLVVAGSTVYVAGQLDAIGGQARASAAAIASDGTLTPWAPAIDGGHAATVFVDGDRVYLGGPFAYVGGTVREGAAAVSAADASLLPWTLPIGFEVTSFAKHDGALYVGFPNYARLGLRAVDPVTGTPTAWDPGVSGVHVLADAGDGLLVGGDPVSFSGVARECLVVLEPDGTLSPLQVDVDGVVQAIATDGAMVYVGGNFTHVGGQARSRLAQLDSNSPAAPVTAWTFDANFAVDALLVTADELIVGGKFDTVAGAPRHRLAAISLAAPALSAWAPDLDGPVYALQQRGSTVFAGGAFTMVGTTARLSLAAFDLDNDGALTAWNPGTTSYVSAVAPGTVRALALVDTTLYVGGEFVSLGGWAATNLGAVDAVTGARTSTWRPQFNDEVLALAAEGTTVYVGGRFTQVDGFTHRALVAIDPISSLISTLGGLASFAGAPWVTTLSLEGSALHVGGEFTAGDARAPVSYLAVPAGP